MIRAALVVVLASCASTAQTPAGSLAPPVAEEGPVVAADEADGVPGIAAGACETIDGTIVEMDTGEPLADVEVATGSEEDREVTRTGPDGRFVMRYRGHEHMYVTDAAGNGAYLPLEANGCSLGPRYVKLYPP